MNPTPILDLIAKHESDSAVKPQRAASSYDVVWGGIKRADYPPAPLTQMTIAAVLEWQDSIDIRYQSEAAGRYQLMEDTLRGLGSLAVSTLFDAHAQDRLAIELLDRRGWSRLVAGEITPERFADALAREWASLPVQSDQNGASRPVKRGQSYYAGDGLNKAHATPEEVMTAISAAIEPIPEPVETFDARVAAWLRAAPPGALAWLQDAPT